MEKFWTSRHNNDDIFGVSDFDTLHENEWDESSIVDSSNSITAFKLV